MYKFLRGEIFATIVKFSQIRKIKSSRNFMVALIPENKFSPNFSLKELFSSPFLSSLSQPNCTDRILHINHISHTCMFIKFLIYAQRKRVVIFNLPGNIIHCTYIHTYVRNQTSSHPAIMETAVLIIESQNPGTRASGWKSLFGF